MPQVVLMNPKIGKNRSTAPGTEAVRERFYAISCERIIKHRAVAAISDAARKGFLIMDEES